MNATDIAIRALKARLVEMIATLADRTPEVGWDGVLAALTKRQAMKLSAWAQGDFDRDLDLSAIVRAAHALNVRIDMRLVPQP